METNLLTLCLTEKVYHEILVKVVNYSTESWWILSCSKRFPLTLFSNCVTLPNYLCHKALHRRHQL